MVRGLRLRQMGDADGVFPGDGVTRSGGTERGGAAGSAGGGKKIGFRQCSIGGLESRQRAFSAYRRHRLAVSGLNC